MEGAGRDRTPKQEKVSRSPDLSHEGRSVETSNRRVVSLASFLPLLPGEQKLLDACLQEQQDPGASITELPPRARLKVRGNFVRFLALGGDQDCPAPPQGLRVASATVEGRLVLTGCAVPQRLEFINCNIDSTIEAEGTQFKHLIFADTNISGFNGDGAEFKGGLFFINSVCHGEFRILQSVVKGSLVFKASTLCNPRKITLAADRIKVDGSLSLDTGFRSIGQVRLHNSQVRGIVSFRDSKFLNPREKALSLDGAEIRGSVFLFGTWVIGETRLARTMIGGNISVAKARFCNSKRMAFDAQSLRLGGGLIWRGLRQVSGSVSLSSAKAVDLVDELSSWLKADSLILDGFEYGRITGTKSSTDATSRIRWLKHQNPGQFKASFWPQPWEHLAKVLREMGHPEDAKVIGIEKQRQLMELGLVGARKPRPGLSGLNRLSNRIFVKLTNGFALGLHSAYGMLAGYGYRPLQTVGWMVISWLLGTLVYWLAAQDGLLGPANVRIYTDEHTSICGTGGDVGKIAWTSCPAVPAEYVRFNPFIYSLDLSLPVVDLHQESEWTPLARNENNEALRLGWLLRLFVWVQIVFGWLTSLLLVSAVGRLIQGDK
jgi:hypothetical protein